MKHPIIQKRIDYFKSYTDENEDQALLQTIRIPKNLLFLSDKLPQANYDKSNNKKNHSFTKKGSNDLPDIRANNPINKKQKIKEQSEEASSSEGASAQVGSANANNRNKSASENKDNDKDKERGRSNNPAKHDTNEEKSKARNKSPTNRVETSNYLSENNIANIAQLHINGAPTKQPHKQASSPKNGDLPQLKQKRNDM